MQLRPPYLNERNFDTRITIHISINALKYSSLVSPVIHTKMIQLSSFMLLQRSMAHSRKGTSEDWNRYLKGLNPKERDEFLKFVNPECHTCGTVIGHLYTHYKRRLEGGERPDDLMKDFNLGYCCHAALAHPALIPPGLIYNNSRTRDKVEFATKAAEQLLAEHTVQSEQGSDPLWGSTGVIQASISSSGREVLELSVADTQTRDRTTGTPLPPNVVFEDEVGDEYDELMPENAIIDDSFFAADFNKKGIPKFEREREGTGEGKSEGAGEGTGKGEGAGERVRGPRSAAPRPAAARPSAPRPAARSSLISGDTEAGESYITALGKREVGQSGTLASDANIAQFFEPQTDRDIVEELSRFEEQIASNAEDKQPPVKHSKKDTTAFIFLPTTIHRTDPVTGRSTIIRRYEI